MPGAMYVAQTTEMFRRNAAGQGLIDEHELPATVFPAAGTWNQFQSMTEVEQEALRLNTAGSPPLASTTKSHLCALSSLKTLRRFVALNSGAADSFHGGRLPSFSLVASDNGRLEWFFW
jgi:hypothetical protein